MTSSVLVSAHRCNDRAAVLDALRLGADFVEFDLDYRDGRVVVAHDRSAEAVIDFHDLLELLAAGSAKAHLDLKFATADGEAERAAVTTAVAALGDAGVVVTTLDDQTVRQLREWSDRQAWALRLGLSLGRSVRGLPWRRQVSIRLSELFPHRRMRASGADIVVAHRVLARLGVARFARRAGLPLLVWTVDSSADLTRWLEPSAAWMVTTNRPELALAIRARAERLSS